MILSGVEYKDGAEGPRDAISYWLVRVSDFRVGFGKVCDSLIDLLDHSRSK